MCYDSPPATSAWFARSLMNALFSIHFSVCLLVQLLVPFFQRSTVKSLLVLMPGQVSAVIHSCLLSFSCTQAGFTGLEICCFH